MSGLSGSALALALLAAVPAAAPVPLGGTTFYVSPSGRDGDSGTSPTRAWRTLDRVGQQRLQAGDTVLFEGGQSFSGTLDVSPGENGTSTSPITFGSYGTGRATIQNSRDRGIDIYNAAGLMIRDLVIAGAGPTSTSEIGISLYVDLPGNTKLSWIRIDNVRVTGFRRSGISIGGGNGRTGFQDVRVENCQLDHNGDNGVLVWASTSAAWPQTIDGYPHRSLYFGHNTFASNWGDPAITARGTGSGIVVGQAALVTIEYNEAYDNGRLNRCPNGGPHGIWVWDTFQALIQRNESHHNSSPTYDGGGFDCDGGTVQSVMQYNYSHDNEGPGFLVTQFQGSKPQHDVTVRYNISERDGGRAGAAGLQLWNNDNLGPPVDDVVFHNNTVFVEGKSVGTPRCFRGDGIAPVTGSGFVNNIFYSRGSAWVGESTLASCSWIGNLYFDADGDFVIRQGGAFYSSLSAWRAATRREMVGANTFGYEADPLLMAPGFGGTVGDADSLGELSAYRLRPRSMAPDLGIYLPSLGISAGPLDFYGGPSLLGGGYDLGAHERR